MGAQEVRHDWVPVERRWLGIDRRTILPGVLAVCLAIVLTGLLPAINRSIEYDRQIKAGDVVNLGSGLTFTPAPGWGFPDGLLLSQSTVGGAEKVTHLGATIESGSTSVAVTSGPFAGTADELMSDALKVNVAYKRIDNAKVSAGRGTITTSSGIAGVAQAFAGVNVEGLTAVFVVGGIGVEFLISGPPGAVVDNAETIAKMLNSLSFSKPEAK